MSIRLKIFLFIIWALILLYLFYKMKIEKAHIRFILPWILLDVCMIFITAFPAVLNFFCRLFGIETPSNMLFFFGMIFLTMIVFLLTLSVSRQKEEIRKLTQEIALLKKERE